MPPRLLRRSRTDRIGAGVAGGLGEYFDVDPVLFRVLFATAAFFGGAGVLAYLLAWAAIPEQGTGHAPIDGFVRGLRRRRVPVWLVAIVAGALFWAVAFSWWAPRPFIPVLVIVIVLVLIFSRRAQRGGWRGPDGGWHAQDTPMPPGPPSATGTVGSPATAETVSLAKDAGDAAATSESPAGDTDAMSRENWRSGWGTGWGANWSAAGHAGTGVPGAPPTWAGETRQWISEARAASRERRRRAFPLRIGAIGVLVLTLATIGVVDAAVGVALPVYFWVTLGIVAGTLLVGMALRRTPWSLSVLLIPTVAGLIAFGATGAQLHDGFGARDWTPTSEAQLHSAYRLAFGQAVLDLRHVGPLASGHELAITVAAGQVRVIAPSTVNVTVEASVHAGQIEVDGQDTTDTGGSHGYDVSRTVLPPTTASGAPVTVRVHLADGQISVEHRS